MQPELLAPAGDREKLEYALAYGADAVYAGQPQYSLRARENGFAASIDIASAIEYTHGLGRKFYLTSNILPHNNKIQFFRKSLGEYIELKPDAIIMTDPGMIHWVRKNFPKQEIHLSVQGNCTNWSTAEFWKEIGVTRIILSRELNLREIKEIRENVPDLELEVFIHGAICMAHSGRCLLSNYMSYRDSNQGMCSNACRLKYSVYTKNSPQSDEYIPLDGQFFLKPAEANEGILRSGDSNQMMEIDEDTYGTYIMNSKDMCAIDVLGELHELGICSFKIEGRTKSIYYLSQVVTAYRGAIDDLMAGRSIHPKHKERLEMVESRGTMPGFAIPSRESGPLPQNFEATRVPSKTAQVAGFIRGYDAQTGLAKVSVRGQIRQGDTLECVTPEGSYTLVASQMINHKNKAVDKLDSGLENCLVAISKDPGKFGVLVKIL